MRRATALAAIAVVLFTTSVFARRIVWRIADEPPVSLQSALDLAKAELKDESYFCVGASLAQTFTQGDWELHYATKQGKEMWISVGSDKSVRKSDKGFDY
jgi:hypothetical protein